ncbi:MAG TPA: ATP-binding protein [Candidatus Limnocylindrales bacterium]|nr:ATP-binding protein [Candidatus Limnocylindrales bacterium]
MSFSLLLSLASATVGTLLNLFLMILIVGYRRRRTFERVLFFLALALFLYYAGSLLILNAQIYYRNGPPRATEILSVYLVAIGLAALPGLLVHTHFSYGWAQGGMSRCGWQAAVIGAAYIPVVRFAALISGIAEGGPFAFPVDENAREARVYLIWLALVLISCIALQLLFARRTHKTSTRRFHNFLAVYFAAYGLLVLNLVAFHTTNYRGVVMWIGPSNSYITLEMFALVIGWLLPVVLLVYVIIRYKALEIGSQNNLVYSVSAAFLALLYLGAVRRVSGLLEPALPPEATSAILLFILVGFFEPLQRVTSRLFKRRFQEQVDRLQRLSSELQREAQHGDMGRLIAFAEESIKKEFGLEEVRIRLSGKGAEIVNQESSSPKDVAKPRPAWAGQPVRLLLGKAGAEIGELEAVPIGSAISGETSAAMDFLAEQLPAVIELCQLIEQKLVLERELDERERLALVGQMATSISHNLKNPLGSMKTVLQVQLESADLPARARRDLTMVVGEIDRLGVKLNQLLRYARPAVRAGAGPQRAEVGVVAEQVVSLLRHEAERRRCALSLTDDSARAVVRGSEEPLTDILSNLIVNAIEAIAEGGRVIVSLARDGPNVILEIADDGPGIPAENRERLFQPFFTTKPSGTGLGLAIVERRVAELGGSIHCESPVAGGRGARFKVRLPAA